MPAASTILAAIRITSIEVANEDLSQGDGRVLAGDNRIFWLGKPGCAGVRRQSARHLVHRGKGQPGPYRQLWRGDLRDAGMAQGAERSGDRAAETRQAQCRCRKAKPTASGRADRTRHEAEWAQC